MLNTEYLLSIQLIIQLTSKSFYSVYNSVFSWHIISVFTIQCSIHFLELVVFTIQFSIQSSYKLWYSVFNTLTYTGIQYSVSIQHTKILKYPVFTVFGIHVFIGLPDDDAHTIATN